MKRTEVPTAKKKGKLCHAGAGAEHLAVYESYDALQQLSAISVG
jgi:hypothetical protein